MNNLNIVPTKQLQTFAEQHPATDFKWRDRHHKFHAVKDMATRHLFYTLRMIWNHTMPETAQFHPFQRYSFGRFYTDAYMQDAIRAIVAELGRRYKGNSHALPYDYLYTLDAMITYLKTPQIQEQKP